MADVPNPFAGAQLPRTPIVLDLARVSRPAAGTFDVTSSRYNLPPELVYYFPTFLVYSHNPIDHRGGPTRSPLPITVVI
eukprot:SAG11_NODE_30567_length_302_cov_3.720000_1_plen_78_part_01